MADDIEIEVDLTDFTKGLKKVDDAEKLAIMQAARSIGGEAAGFAKEICPVDTGLLKNSITFALSGEEPHEKAYKADRPNEKGELKSGSYSGAMPKEKELAIYIGSNVEYAEKQENGDFQHHAGQSKHFLKKAATDHTPRYKEIIETALEAAKP